VVIATAVYFQHHYERTLIRVSEQQVEYVVVQSTIAPVGGLVAGSVAHPQSVVSG
jgi:hypothetical protein